jgi:two-component system response regulator MprA
MGPRAATRPRASVLVIDDDARSASLLARMLRSDGYEAEVTNDGALAIARLTRDPLPDVVITELHLPHVDGLAIARYARSRCAGTVIMFLTAYPHALVGTTRSADEPLVLLTKPLDYAELLVRLAALPHGPADTG